MAGEQAVEIRRVAGALAAGLSRLGLQRVQDPRKEYQVERPLVGVLAAVLLGLAAGLRSLSELERLTTKLAHPLRRRLKLWGRLPDTTVRTVLMRLNPGELRAVLHRQVRSAHRSKQLEPDELPFGVCAIDGKSTSTRKPQGPFAQQQGDGALLRTMTCALVSAKAPAVLDAIPVPADTNEMGIFGEVLAMLAAAYSRLNLFRLISADAGMTSEANARAVRSHGWDYLLALKDTQPTLRAEAERLIGPHRQDPPAAETVDLRDNRTTVVRSVWLTEEAAGYHDWTHLRTIVRVRREVRHDDGNVLSCDDRYFLSSLTSDALTPALWLKVVRAHWRVENDVHGGLDRFYEEDDRPWLYATPGQLAVALLRRVVLNMIALHRNVSRRGERKGNVPWRELIHTAHVVLVGATEQHLIGLRWPKFVPYRARGQPR